MSREDLELEKVITAFAVGQHEHKVEDVMLIVGSEFSDLATAIMIWHKQREVELLERLLKNMDYTGRLADLERQIENKIKYLKKRKKLIKERMVGKG